MRRVFTRQTREFGRHRGEISKRVLAQLSAIIPFRDSSPVLTITHWYLLDQGCTFHLYTSLRPPRLLDSRLNSIQDDGLSRGPFSGCPGTYFLQMVHTLSKGYCPSWGRHQYIVAFSYKAEQAENRVDNVRFPGTTYSTYIH